MRNALEFFKKKKREELLKAEDALSTPTPEPLLEEEIVDQGRRSLLFGIGATAAVAAMPSVLSSTEAVAASLDPIRKNETFISETMAHFKRDLATPEVRDARSGKGPLIGTMMRTLKRFDPKEVIGTSYDCTRELMQHCVQYAYGKNREGKRVSVCIPASAGPEHYMPPTVGYGNGFFWGAKNIFVTAHHVFDFAMGRQDSKKKADIYIQRMAPEFEARPEQVIHDCPWITDADVDGAFVSIVGIDKDATAMKAGAVGCKMYSGGAVRLTREWVDVAFGKADDYFKERLYRSFIVEIPRGEAIEAPDVEKPSAGMSGAPVFMVKDGIKVFAGFIHAVKQGPDKDFAIFYGPEFVRESFAQFNRTA